MSDIAAETATTPTETVTTQPATGDGKIQTEPAQPLRTLETAEQRIKELNAENLRLRKQADAAAKAKTDAEAAVMAEPTSCSLPNSLPLRRQLLCQRSKMASMPY